MTVKNLQPQLGATLLEIMLVLAIAAAILVASLRFYQNSVDAANIDRLTRQVQVIISAASKLTASGTGFTGVTTGSITNLVGSKGMETPYGNSIVIHGGSTHTAFNIYLMGLPKAVCVSLTQRLEANPHIKCLIWQPNCAPNNMICTYTSTGT